MVLWKEQYARDQSAIKILSDEARKLNINYESLFPRELEAELVYIHKLQNQVNALKDKYDNAVRSDDEERKLIRNIHEPKQI